MGYDMTQWRLKTAAKAVLRHRKTSVAAAGILSIGIGMSVAMFSLVDAVLLRPLPFPRQQSIEVIWKWTREPGGCRRTRVSRVARIAGKHRRFRIRRGHANLIIRLRPCAADRERRAHSD
jgi:hypothetical protein